MTNSKAFSLLLVLLVILGVLAVSAGSYFGYQRISQERKQPSKEAIEKPVEIEEVPAEPTAEWKTYDNPTYRYRSQTDS